MNGIASWIASGATMIAAMMTAANLGARITGIGFVIMALGSVAWVWDGVSTGQTSLIVTNAFLTLVNLAGVWRWLIRQDRYETGGKSAKSNSQKSSGPTVFTASGLANMRVVDDTGADIGTTVEGLIECGDGTISYVVISSKDGSAGEQLRGVPRDALEFKTTEISLRFARAAFDALTPLPSGDWPAHA